MNLFGKSLNAISQSLMEYQNPLPEGIKQWNAEVIEEILEDEIFAGYKFIFEEEVMLAMRVSMAIIPKEKSFCFDSRVYF